MTDPRSYVGNLTSELNAIDLETVQACIDLLAKTRDDEAMIFVCGNGGSAATASHFATDLGKGASYGRSKRFRVVALTDNVPIITAYSNDVDYDIVFSEQLRGLARPGDVLVTISGSGTSRNIIKAITEARDIGLTVVSMTGFEGGKSGPMADIHINVPSDHMGRIEDAHMAVCHMIAFTFIEGCHASH